MFRWIFKAISYISLQSKVFQLKQERLRLKLSLSYYKNSFEQDQRDLQQGKEVQTLLEMKQKIYERRKRLARFDAIDRGKDFKESDLKLEKPEITEEDLESEYTVNDKAYILPKYNYVKDKAVEDYLNEMQLYENLIKLADEKIIALKLNYEHKRKKKEMTVVMKKITESTTWSEWKEINKDNLKHVAGFEEKFVDDILSKIKEIKPADVISQYHFVDKNGNNRYIDFLIINKYKGYRLPIELDGYGKMQMGYGKFNDFLERQNSLISHFRIVLRFSNNKMRDYPDEVIKEIRDTLSLQAKGKVTKAVIVKKYKETIEEYKQIIAQKNTEKQTSEEWNQKVESVLKEILIKVEKNEIANEKAIYSNNSKEATEKKLLYPLIGVVSVLLISLSVFFYFAKKSSDDIAKTDMALTYSEPVEANQESVSLITSKEQESVPVNKGSNNQIKNLSESAAYDNSINSVQAQNYIGEFKTVCGTVVEVIEFSKGVYLNYDKKYPNQSVTAVIWENNTELAKNANSFLMKHLCIKGEISEYSNKPQISINSTTQIVK